VQQTAGRSRANFLSLYRGAFFEKSSSFLASPEQIFRYDKFMPAKQNRFILALDITGTFVFAIEGALAAIHAGLDLLGVMVLAVCTALGGGIIRDVLIGAAPPSALRDWRYPGLAFAGAALTFIFYPIFAAVPPLPLIALDAAGLALFAVAGTEKALECKIPPLNAALMGTVTAVGGGTVRDMLLTHIPAVLRVDIYATAALAGAALLVLLRRLGLPAKPAAFCGFMACFALRIVSVLMHWHLPVLRA
jgi:uncharacterized membrane protein YeiH